jgi:YVTN family beta-propeller protein
MSLRRIVIPALSALLLLFACDNADPPLDVTPNPVPSALSLEPPSAVAGSAGFTLTINGSDFVPGSKVRWNGADRATTFVSATQLTAAIAASDLSAATTAAVTVYNGPPGGGTSGVLNFTVDPAPNPVPSVASLQPSSVTAGAPGFTLTVNGGNFLPSSIVRWNGLTRTTTYASATQLNAAIPASDVGAATTASVTVYTPPPGGGTSGAVTFTIAPPLTWSLTPVAIAGGTWDATVASNGTVYVTHFLIDSITRIDVAGNARAGTFRVGQWPYEVKFNAAGTVAYATNLDANTVSVIDATTHAETTTWSVASRPIRVVVGPGGSKLYVSLINGNVAILNTANGSAASPPVFVGGVLNGLVLTQGGTRLWAGNTSGGAIEINTTTDLPTGRSITVNGIGQDMVVSPDGNTLYLGVEEGWVGVYDLTNLARIDSIPVTQPFGMALNPAGTQLWVSASRSGIVSVISTATRRYVGRVTTGGAPRHIAFTSDGTALIANENGAVYLARQNP